MGSEQNRFPPQERKRWGGCWGAFSCFGNQKGGKRIVPASRMPEGNASSAQANGPQAVSGLTNQATSLAPSLLAPPSSPASLLNSALPSTAQSPSSFLSLSANSPGGPSSSMYATGPYAHEPQLVSPPVFSTFTTEPSTAPLTPPPELAHLTTPSSPDVPFARFLTSSADLESADKNNYIGANDLQSTYSLYSDSPASSLRSPISRTGADCLSSSFPEREFRPQWNPSISPRNGKHSRSGSGKLFGHDVTGSSIGSQDTNFFCPETFAQYYLDQNPLPHAGGRLSVSKDSDVYPTSVSGIQNKQTKPKQDVEELEAYRASFGFSADEIITTTQYVEISDITDDLFTIEPFPIDKHAYDESMELASIAKRPKTDRMQENFPGEKKRKSKPNVNRSVHHDAQVSCNAYEDHKSRRQVADVSGSCTPMDHTVIDEEDIFLKRSSSRSRKYQSDAEIDYRRERSYREVHVSLCVCVVKRRECCRCKVRNWIIYIVYVYSCLVICDSRAEKVNFMSWNCEWMKK